MADAPEASSEKKDDDAAPAPPEEAKGPESDPDDDAPKEVKEKHSATAINTKGERPAVYSYSSYKKKARKSNTNLEEEEDEDEEEEEEEEGEEEVKKKPVKRGPRRLIDILHPKKEPLPVILPPIGDKRKNLLKKLSIRASQNIIPDGAAVPVVPGDEIGNPFRYPPSIEEYIARSDIRKAEERRKAALIPPLMKGTKGYKQTQTVLERIRPFLSHSVAGSLSQDYRQVIWKANNGLHINHLQKVSRKLHTEYIMQRKNVYYLRRAIRARKVALEMIAKTREFEEACLKDYEWLTDFTKQAFEQFLKENDDCTQDAAKAAENAVKEKMEKTLEARQLSIQINQMKTEIISTNESLKECKTYMKFLDDIAREIMRKEDDEEVMNQQREVQIKAELAGYVKEGMELQEAEQLIMEKYKDKQDAYSTHQSDDIGHLDFVMALHREVRRNLGLPESDLLTDDGPDDVVVEERKSGVFDDDDDDDDAIVEFSDEEEEEEEEETEEPVLSATDIVQAVLQRQKTRLIGVVAKDEQKAFEKMLFRAADGAKSPPKDEDDEDGYNEVALIKSLDLVPGDEESDKRELASLCFTTPHQLLEIFSDMEEADLTLIQHAQVSEEMLERVNQQIATTRKELNQRGRILRDEINKVQSSIDSNEERANALATLVEMFTGGNYDVRQQQKLYNILQKHITKVYESTVGPLDHPLNPILMLTAIEKNFEDLMHQIQSMPTEVVQQISRELDMERREAERLEKMNERKLVQQERKSRSLDRAQAPIHRRKGRPLLPRSHPPKAVIHLSQAELDRKAEEDEYNYFFGP